MSVTSRVMEARVAGSVIRLVEHDLGGGVLQFEFPRKFKEKAIRVTCASVAGYHKYSCSVHEYRHGHPCEHVRMIKWKIIREADPKGATGGTS